MGTLAAEIDVSAGMLAWAMGSHGSDEEAARRQLVKRAFLIRFSRVLAIDARFDDQLRQFLAAVPPLGFRTVLEFALGRAVSQMEVGRLERARRDPVSLQMGTTMTMITTLLSMTANGLAADLRNGAGDYVNTLAAGKFELLGYDLSLEARSD